ncbi:Nucleoside-diphosphate kinase [Desulfonatronospira thiodismutans ASO3-1]|uniref:Nucleoside diphosphate kinase n=1 Tax=Desulfonatronospira thiodismutans ASO3-1 TaxID=555779 RepID=D6SS33_9BACT|nr:MULTISPECIES: nucleoside-diphosphate kinase [Desulfonatronospira]EFI33499.1 Nucleoside-diphosphate kinase [Desulfonatronospira thiodismutans ASO3-1]RQD74143.1 MAG: nucleoside-diphosphate kinase [Desulfonatronospira sp. MSAO_Bac3]
MTQRTLSIIKPDAVQRNLQGAIMKMIQDSGLKIVAMKMLRLSKDEARGFYDVHKDRPFFDSLTDYMSSGPIVVSILEGENGIDKYREIMGATNPENAQEGTIRKAYALDIEKNSVHGSDAPETAQVEMAYFFSKMEMVG